MIARRLGIKPERTAFVQPILTKNGTLGGSSFAVSANSEVNAPRAAWHAFDGLPEDSTGELYIWHSGQGGPWWYKIYNPIPILITNIHIANGTFTNHMGLKAGSISGSNDNSTWTKIKD